MYLFYLDESGSHDTWTEQDNFVFGGVAVHEGQVRNLSLKIDALQSSVHPGIEMPLEFHAQHILAGKGRYRRMDPKVREEILASLGAIIAGARFPSLIAFIAAIHVSRVVSPQQALRDCLEEVMERFNLFLVRQFALGFKDKGLVIIDASGRDAQIREVMAGFVRSGTRHGYLGNIIDVPHFADSAHTRMLQLADFVAYPGGRYFNSGDDRYMKCILPVLDRKSPRGALVGLKYIVDREKYACPCMHCKD